MITQRGDKPAFDAYLQPEKCSWTYMFPDPYPVFYSECVSRSQDL